MIGIAFRLVEMPDGRLLAVGIPVMLAILHKAIQHRFMLPLIIRASQHKTVFYPDAAACKMKSGINESFSEIQPFGICMEHIGRTAFFQMLRHSLKGRQQECIKLLVLHAVVLYGQTAGTLKRNAIGRIGQNEICLGVTHKSRYIFRRCCITAHQLVSANCPYIATPDKSCLLQGGGQVEVIFFCLAACIRTQQICQFLFIKSGHGKVEAELLQFLHFNGQQFFVPASI